MDSKKVYLETIIVFLFFFKNLFSCKISLFDNKMFYIGKIVVLQKEDKEKYNFKAYKINNRLYFSLSSIFSGKLYEIKAIKGKIIHKDINTGKLFYVKSNSVYEEMPFIGIRYTELVCLIEPKFLKKQGRLTIITPKFSKEKYIEIVEKKDIILLFLNKHYIIRRKIKIKSLHNKVHVIFNNYLNNKRAILKGDGFEEVGIEYIKRSFHLFF